MGEERKLETLVMRLYQARQESAKARRERNAERKKSIYGDLSCSDDLDCWTGDETVDSLAVRPYSDAYYKAANKAGAALRSVLREGKLLTQKTGGAG